MSQTFKVHAVDDDPLILDVIRAILEPEYRFTAFENAEACCATLETDKPDLFFLDVSLPGMNGFDLCRKIKEDVKKPILDAGLAYKAKNRAFEEAEMAKGGNVHQLILALVNGR